MLLRDPTDGGLLGVGGPAERHHRSPPTHAHAVSVHRQLRVYGSQLLLSEYTRTRVAVSL